MTSKGIKPTPEQQLQAAIERAQQAGLRVVAEGHLVGSKALVCFVPSQSSPDQWHRIINTGKRLVCDCFVGQRSDLVCVHRAVTYLYLKAQRQSRAS